MNRLAQLCVVTATALWGVAAIAQSGSPNHRPSIILLDHALPNGSITMEQFADNTVIISERSTTLDTPFRRLDLAAKAAGKTLCAAQLFAYLSKDPVPDVLFSRCPDKRKAMSEFDALKARAKTVAILDETVRSRPGFCNNLGNDAQQFKDIECNATLLELFGHSDYGDDSAYWCANTLRSSSVRVQSEGADAHSRTVSCQGNTRFRLYRRDDSSDPWVKYRDHQLGANEFELTHVLVWETFSDSSTKFVIDSSSGAWHRNTGYFVDD